jgi:hypothetical protein
MTAPSDHTELVVQKFWHLMSTNDFYAVKEVLAKNAVLESRQSNERIRDAKKFSMLNVAYPASCMKSMSLPRSA